MLTEPAEAVRARAERLAELTGGTVEETVARAGGGSLPTTDFQSFACALEEELAEPLRRADPPVIGIVRDGALLLDCRTLTDEEVEEAASRSPGAPRSGRWDFVGKGGQRADPRQYT